MSQRSFNTKKTNNHDFVKPLVTRNTSKQLPNLSKWEQYPSFTPLQLDEQLGQPINLENIDSSNPWNYLIYSSLLILSNTAYAVPMQMPSVFDLRAFKVEQSGAVFEAEG
jgi:hypothetical protein